MRASITDEEMRVLLGIMKIPVILEDPLKEPEPFDEAVCDIDTVNRLFNEMTNNHDPKRILEICSEIMSENVQDDDELSSYRLTVAIGVYEKYFHQVDDDAWANDEKG